MPRALHAPAVRLRRVVRPWLALGLVMLALLPVRAHAARMAADADAATRMSAIKQAQRAQLREEPMRHRRAAREYREWLARQKKSGAKGLRARPAREGEDEVASDALPRRAEPAGLASSLSTPANVRANDPAGDAAGVGQAEQSVAVLGQHVLVAWNDGQGFVTGGDVQGYGFSVDGGATFTDGGAPPHPANTIWSSDPSVTVNEKTGDFYYCGLLDSAGTAFSGIGVIKGTFVGSNFVWGTPHVVRTVNASAAFLDKQWLVADSLNGNLYLTYTKFDAGDSIMFQRSTNQGATWGPMLKISSNAASGLVQGSRTVVGPSGEVYVVWSQIGLVDADFMMLRKSTNLGVSFTSEVTVATEFSNFGTGAPGFNRPRGITFPSIAVDRTTSPNRGRVYVAWNEAVDWFDDALNTLGTKVEVEGNNTSGTATLFTPGQLLRGAFSAASDQDWFKFSATAGTSYIFWCDSIPNPLYTMRVFCSDGFTALALSGDTQAPAGGNGFIVWTAPTTATYFFRMAVVSGAASSGGYRVSTAVDAPTAGERSRDWRDAFVTHSDDGTTWATPTRVTDDAALFDDWLPEVAVAGDGCPYVTWFDWRDAAANCAGSSNIYVARSVDGGATWAANQRLTDVSTAWSSTSSNIAPNEGDYQALFAVGRALRPAWADGRGGTADVFTTALDVGHDLTFCPNDTTVDHNTTLPLTFSFTNANVAYANDLQVSLADARGWVSSNSVVTVAAAGGQTLNFNVSVPDSAATGTNQVCFSVTSVRGTLLQQCCVHLGVNGGTTAVPPPTSLGFALAVPRPNPASGLSHIDFTLPAPAATHLDVFSLSGQRVRTLVDGVLGAGPHTAAWDGRDEHGRRVAAGTFFVRLSSGPHLATERLVFLP
ncbi:MAG TPA: FlgD immunoglobulin-like domain containing protein [Candidatus Saccharimonadaceae bacterium]|jgi:hypothetical protein|nr:FlgD immunoglobulin-like domain containing protein [Candidatus Saccharimonadaceae bacterium]